MYRNNDKSVNYCWISFLPPMLNTTRCVESQLLLSIANKSLGPAWFQKKSIIVINVFNQNEKYPHYIWLETDQVPNEQLIGPINQYFMESSVQIAVNFSLGAIHERAKYRLRRLLVQLCGGSSAKRTIRTAPICNLFDCGIETFS